ncbi:MAG TPA: signal peptidase II [Pyrinomonadaceae bacterium]|nr:signal peptidase II [Pyrinomonadaceae bacterium]
MTKGNFIFWRLAYLIAAAGLYLVDQVTKAWAVRDLRRGGMRVVWDGFLNLIYAENSGIAFSQFQDGGAVGRWFFVGLAAVAAAAVLVYFFRTGRDEDRILGACAMLLAGIIGNMTDRARFGYVIDFIDVHIGRYHWPTFNVADAAICAGAFLLLLDMFLAGRREAKGKGGAPEMKSKVNVP